VIAPWYHLPQIEPVTPAESVVIIGAGLAGCALARELAERGVAVKLLDAAASVGGGASGNPAGIAKPFVTREPSYASDFYQQAFAGFLKRMAGGPGQAAGFKQIGVLQLTERLYPTSDQYRNLNSMASCDYAGISINSPSIVFDSGGWLNPRALCAVLGTHPLIVLHMQHKVTAIEADADGCWRVHCHDRSASETMQPLHTQKLVLATGAVLHQTRWTHALPLVPARGQLSRYALKQPARAPQCVISGKHYVIADQQSVLVGATFKRHDTGCTVNEDDHHSNRQGLAALLPELEIHAEPIAGYAGIRCTTPDRLPLVGPAPDVDAYRQVYASLHHGRSSSRYPQGPVHSGLFMLGGLGSRGIVSAPYCAALLADYLCGLPASLQQWAPLLHPARFCVRELKRAQ
jgi:tRNA 5-methylaminomethyl-2-thiouridine biosynthesis bifunctional protein